MNHQHSQDKAPDIAAFCRGTGVKVLGSMVRDGPDYAHQASSDLCETREPAAATRVPFSFLPFALENSSTQGLHVVKSSWPKALGREERISKMPNIHFHTSEEHFNGPDS